MGGGQLGRMMALAGRPLGLRFRFLEEKSPSPVDEMGERVHGAYDDPEALDAFAEGLDVVTYEFENVPAASTDRLEGHVPLHPSPSALAMAQDRLHEKEGFAKHGIPTAPHRTVDSLQDLQEAVEELGLPAILKTRRFGYDGKGQRLLREEAELQEAFDELSDGFDGVPLILEGFVDFRRELSILSVRGRNGTCAFYPLVENDHHQGILWTSLAPADVSPEQQATAEGYARSVLEEHDYVGVLAIELFDTEEGLVANEMAPRVHNSGHWTQDGAVCSQFENHLRAVCGLPLGSTEVVGFSAMENLLGTVPPVQELLAVPGAHLHLYEKSARPGRKLGHVNLVGDDRAAVAARLERLKELARPS